MTLFAILVLVVVAAALLLGKGVRSLPGAQANGESVAPPTSEAALPTVHAPISGGSQSVSTVSSHASNAITGPSTPPVDPHRHLKRYFKTRLDPSLRQIADGFRKGQTAKISVPLFDGREAVVVVEDFTPYGQDGGAFDGVLEGDPGSFVSMAFYQDAESGSIQLPAQNLVYTIQPEPDGSVLVGEVDVAALGACGSCRSDVAVRRP